MVFLFPVLVTETLMNKEISRERRVGPLSAVVNLCMNRLSICCCFSQLLIRVVAENKLKGHSQIEFTVLILVFASATLLYFLSSYLYPVPKSPSVPEMQ